MIILYVVMETESKDIFIPKKVIIHCAATPDYVKTDKLFDLFALSDIEQWHRERGFDCCGYHFVIRQNGEIEQGRPLSRRGAHCRGQNYDSIGICYIGTHRPNSEQLGSVLKLYSTMKSRYAIEFPCWRGHYEFDSSKECPGFSMTLFRLFLKYAQIALKL